MVLIGGFLAASVRVATPLLLAATGETVTERSGIINLGLEGMMLAGALAATLGARRWGRGPGLALAVLAGMVLAAVFAAVAIVARADQIIAGTAITLAAVGLTGTIYREAYGAGGAGLTLPTLAPVADPRSSPDSPVRSRAVRAAGADLPRAARDSGGLVVALPHARRAGAPCHG